MKKNLFQILVLIFLSICVNVHSEVLLTLNASKPTENILVSSESDKITGSQWRNDTANGRRDIGQSFLLASDATLDRFSLLLNGNIQSGTPGAEFTVTLYQSTSAESIGSPLASFGTNGTVAGVIPAEWKAGTGARSWLTFDVPDTKLAAGQYYTVVIGFKTTSVNRNLVLVATPNTYNEGKAWWYDGTTFAAQSFDFAFLVQGKK